MNEELSDLREIIDKNWNTILDEVAVEIEQQYPAMKSLVGKVMQLSRGKANPLAVKRLLIEWLVKQNFKDSGVAQW